jgi:adenosine kinase
MSFSGSYRDHLHPEKLDDVSVSVFLDSMVDSHGGVAANICYNLALLGNEPYLVGSVGTDGALYMEKLARLGINIAHVYESPLPTAAFSVITDRDQNQVGGFYPGAMFDSRTLSLEPWQDQQPLVVVSPHDPAAMRRQIEQCKTYGYSLCYDIGQQVSNAPAEDIRAGLEAAELLILNDYELSVLCKKVDIAETTLKTTIPYVITTLGPRGSRVEGSAVAQPLTIAAAKALDVADPTGAGDAYRAGLCYGIAHGWDMQSAAQLGSVCASFAIETVGTQTHTYDKDAVGTRYFDAYGVKPPL